MESNQTTPTNAGIPEGIPTGVFVPNNQTPTVPAETPVQNIFDPHIVPPTPTQSEPTQSVPAKEGALDRFFKGLAQFIAKITGNPDPITGELSSTAKATASKTANIVDKVWNVANKAVSTATDVASKTTTAVTQATEKIQQVIPPPSAVQQQPVQTSTPTQEQQPVQTSIPTQEQQPAQASTPTTKQPTA